MGGNENHGQRNCGEENDQQLGSGGSIVLHERQDDNVRKILIAFYSVYLILMCLDF